MSSFVMAQWFGQWSHIHDILGSKPHQSPRKIPVHGFTMSHSQDEAKGVIDFHQKRDQLICDNDIFWQGIQSTIASLYPGVQHGYLVGII